MLNPDKISISEKIAVREVPADSKSCEGCIAKHDIYFCRSLPACTKSGRTDGKTVIYVWKIKMKRARDRLTLAHSIVILCIVEKSGQDLRKVSKSHYL